MDLSGAETAILQALGSLLLAVLSGLGTVLLRRWGVHLSMDKTQRLEQIADIALAWAVQKSMTQIRHAGWDRPETIVSVVQTAAAYANAKYAESLNKVGVPASSPASAQTQGELTGILERRYPDVLAQKAAVHLALDPLRGTSRVPDAFMPPDPLKRIVP